VVGVGLLVPLIVQPLATRQRVAFSVVAPILVILGGLLLRFVVVYAGQASHWSPI
jgi:protein NrfD